MILNINITTPNSTSTFFVKLESRPSYDYIQCDPLEATHIAVLRYIPYVAEVVPGEVYSVESSLFSLPVSFVFTALAIDFIDVFVRKSGESWIQVGKNVPADIINPTFNLLQSDFATGDVIDVKICDCDSMMYSTISGIPLV